MTAIEEKCVDRFVDLKDYFNGIHVEDLPKFPPQYFENLAKDRHKALMYLFLQSIRSEMRQVQRPVDISCEWCGFSKPIPVH